MHAAVTTEMFSDHLIQIFETAAMLVINRIQTASNGAVCYPYGFYH